MTTFKSFRNPNALTESSETWHTCSWRFRAPACQVASFCTCSFGSNCRLNIQCHLHFIIWNLDFHVSTSNDHNSGSSHRRELSFGHKVPLDVLCQHLEDQADRIARSLVARRAVASCLVAKLNIRRRLQHTISPLPFELGSWDLERMLSYWCSTNF